VQSYWSGFEYCSFSEAREVKKSSGVVLGISDTGRRFNMASAWMDYGNFTKTLTGRESALRKLCPG
jgi:hypothetical protein